MSDRELRTQTALSTLRAAVSTIPIVGTAINEYVFDTRARVKQARVNTFVSEFAEYMTEHQSVPLDIHQIEKEEFGDFF